MAVAGLGVGSLGPLRGLSALTQAGPNEQKSGDHDALACERFQGHLLTPLLRRDTTVSLGLAGCSDYKNTQYGQSSLRPLGGLVQHSGVLGSSTCQ